MHNDETSGAGRGKKQCKVCHAYVGVRTSTCKCGAVFSIKLAVPANNELMEQPLEKLKESIGSVKEILAKVENREIFKKSKLYEEEKNNSYEQYTRKSTIEFTEKKYGRGVILFPSGPCPIKPQGNNSESIRNWALDVYNSGEGKYAPSAILYWARYFWDINSPDFSKVREIIKETLEPSKPEEIIL